MRYCTAGSRRDAVCAAICKTRQQKGKQREMKMAVQHEENILPDLKPFLDENLRLTAIPAKNKKKLSALYYLAGKN